MAAGRGMRMMPLTESIPKAMAIVDGKTMIASGIDKIRRQIEHIHITVGYKGAMLAAHVIEHEVSSIFNTEGKGNAWWVYNTLLANTDAPVLVLTCDNVVELNLERIMSDYESFGAPAGMIVPVEPIAGLEGDFIHLDEKARITRMDRAEPTPIYASGIQVLNPKKINKLTKPTENFYDLWQGLMTEGELYCSKVYPDQWYAVDTVEQLNALNEKRA